jgi:hypothetical protein
MVMVRRTVALLCASISLAACGSPVGTASDPSVSPTPGAAVSTAAPSPVVDAVPVPPMSATSPAGAWPPPKDHVYGTVTTTSGEPLVGICVSIDDNENDGNSRYLRTTTDALGRYRWLAASFHRGVRYDITARVEVWDCTDAGRYENAQTYSRPRHREPVNFRLGLGMAIVGQAVDELGRPIAGLCVGAHDGRTDSTTEVLRTVAADVTDASGRFQLAGLGDSSSGTGVSAGYCEQETYRRQFGGVDTGDDSSERGPSANSPPSGATKVPFQRGETATFDLEVRHEASGSPSPCLSPGGIGC